MFDTLEEKKLKIDTLITDKHIKRAKWVREHVLKLIISMKYGMWQNVTNMVNYIKGRSGSSQVAYSDTV